MPILSPFVFQYLTNKGMIFVMWKHRWRWKVLCGKVILWEEEMNMVVQDLKSDERVRTKGLAIRKRLHLVLYNIMYRMMFEAKFESQGDHLFIDDMEQCVCVCVKVMYSDVEQCDDVLEQCDSWLTWASRPIRPWGIGSVTGMLVKRR